MQEQITIRIRTVIQEDLNDIEKSISDEECLEKIFSKILRDHSEKKEDHRAWISKQQAINKKTLSFGPGIIKQIDDFISGTNFARAEYLQLILCEHMDPVIEHPNEVIDNEISDALYDGFEGF